MLTLIIRSRAPLRISFGGGGTDVSPYYEEKGGAVLSTTIDKYAYCNLQPRPDNGIIIRSHDYDLVASYEESSALALDGNLDLPKAVVSRFELKGGVEILTHCDAPPGSGLGSSSAMVVAMVGAVKHLLNLPLTDYDIAETSYLIERKDVGISGGKQDQYAATFGGFNFIEFSPGFTTVSPLRIKQELLDELQYRLMLFNTGKRRVSARIIDDQTKGYMSGQKDVVQALNTTKELAYKMKSSLLRGNLDNFGELLHMGWLQKCKFSDKVTDPEIDRMYETALKNGAVGGKLLGAGGGGFMLLFCDYTRKHVVGRELRKLGAELVPFQFDSSGLRTWTVNSNGVALG